MYQLPDDFRMFVAVADGFSDTIVAMADNYDDAVRLASIAGLKHITEWTGTGSNSLGLTDWEEVRDYFGIFATEVPLNSAVLKNADDFVLYQEVKS